MRNLFLILLIIGATMLKKIKTPIPSRTNLIIQFKKQGIVGGKSLIPDNLKQFTLEQLQGHSYRELLEISKNRAKPPVNRVIKPRFVMPKEGHT